MLSRSSFVTVAFRSRSLSAYLIEARAMSSSAFIVPFDHQSADELVPGVDASKLWATTPQGEKPPPVGTVRTFYNTPASKVTSVSSLGEKFSSKKTDAKRELVRKSVGSAVKVLKALDGLKDVSIDASKDPHASGVLHFTHDNVPRAPDRRLCIAVAAYLALYKFTLKTKPPSQFNPNLKEPIPDKLKFTPIEASKEWDRGVVYAKAQNFARTVSLPSSPLSDYCKPRLPHS